jgi:hypothetical protein
MSDPDRENGLSTNPAKMMYQCRCYQVGNRFEMWILDPATGTYTGPIPCTEEMCRTCNMSPAVVVGE